jgi:quinol monooxygenase YgiN
MVKIGPSVIPQVMANNARFDWKDLHGKTLEIRVSEDKGENGNCTVVVGRDREDGKVYILVSEYRDANCRD